MAIASVYSYCGSGNKGRTFELISGGTQQETVDVLAARRKTYGPTFKVLSMAWNGANLIVLISYEIP